MKINRWLFVLLVILASVTIYLVTTTRKSTLNKESHDFAVKDTSSITKIFLANRNGNTITLERKAPDKWLLNGKDEPKQDLVKLLLDVIYRVEVRSPVAKAAYNNVVKTLAASAVKCEIYTNGNSVPAKIFYVGGQTADDMGTFMMLENSDMPYITYIPGFNGYLTPRFSLDPVAWSSTSLFEYRPGEIKSVMINYKNAPDHSFLIYRQGNGYMVLNPTNNQFIFPNDSVAVENYLYQYQNVNYESVVGKEKRDTLKLDPSTVRISIKDIHDKLKEVEIFPYPVTSASLAQNDSLGRPLKYDLDRVYGLITPENKLVTIQQPILNRLLRSGRDFAKK